MKRSQMPTSRPQASSPASWLSTGCTKRVLNSPAPSQSSPPQLARAQHLPASPQLSQGYSPLFSAQSPLNNRGLAFNFPLTITGKSNTRHVEPDHGSENVTNQLNVKALKHGIIHNLWDSTDKFLHSTIPKHRRT